MQDTGFAEPPLPQKNWLLHTVARILQNNSTMSVTGETLKGFYVCESLSSDAFTSGNNMAEAHALTSFFSAVISPTKAMRASTSTPAQDIWCQARRSQSGI
eukprot:466854-Amphidinium_carterae.1